MVKYLLGLVVAIVFIIYFSENRKNAVKRILMFFASVLLSVVIVLCVLFGLLWWLFGGLAAEVSVSEYKYSPNKTYTAYEVGYAGSAIDGNCNIIYVKKYKPGDENKENAYKRGEELYRNEVGNPIAFKWKSDNCLIIEGEEYIIDY